jgi:NAD(P)-dependent dehydrogenase (short-subunit alcohol dehydrogenase family)
MIIETAGMLRPLWRKGELGAAAAHDSPTKTGQRRYTASKLANVLFSCELARRLPAGVKVNAFDPGLMPGTGLAREAAAPLRWLWNHVLPRAIRCWVVCCLRIFTARQSRVPRSHGWSWSATWRE